MATNPLIALYAQQAAARHAASAQIRAAMDGPKDDGMEGRDRGSTQGQQEESVTTENADGTKTTRTTKTAAPTPMGVASKAIGDSIVEAVGERRAAKKAAE